MNNIPKPLLIYDGDCRFCTLWIERWRGLTKDKVDYEPSQTAAPRFPEIPAKAFDSGVQWIGEDGQRCAGAHAVLTALSTGSWAGRLLLALYHVSLFGRAAEALYRFVAGHRRLFSFFTRLLWGGDVRRPTYAKSTWLFLRLLGAVYLIAFVSFALQLDGLIGQKGVLPAAEFFKAAGEFLGTRAFWQLPTACWWANGDAALHLLTWGGVIASIFLVIGVAPLPCLVFLWADYLSLTIAGQIFYQYQWDIFLLETGFLAILAAPLSFCPARAANPPRIAHFLLIWLLFRVMFSSGVVKLTSGDAAWSEGFALNYHYFTQPLPTPLAWFFHQMPEGFQKASLLGMFGLELIFPFLLFCPRRLRLIGAGGLALLQVLIALTGNYGFFNLLTLALCLLALDDVVLQQWGRFFWRGISHPEQEWPARFLFRWVRLPVAVALFLISLVPLLATFRKPLPVPGPLVEVYESVAPFRSINGYGLFAVMTRERREIIIEGSQDGVSWVPYVFRYQPGPLHRAPPWVAPYMPRLDWQMWFAALGTVEQNPWFVRLMERLLQGEPAVLELLDYDPFEGNPPRFLRAVSEDYQFTNLAECQATGNWWKARPAPPYCPVVSLQK